MEATRRRGRLRLLLIVAGLYRLLDRPCSRRFPTTHETLQAIGRRLEPVVVRARFDRHRIPRRLDPGTAPTPASERRWRGAISGSRSTRRSWWTWPSPFESIPFWIGDQGFRATDLVLENPDTAWRLFRKTFEPGWIGLGVNSLDRTPVAHYVVFVRPSDGRNPSTRQPSRDSRSSPGRVLEDNAGSTRASARPMTRTDRSGRCPSELVGAVLLQPSHAERHRPLLATRPGLEDPCRLELAARPGHRRVWLRRGSRAGLDLEDLA